MGEHNAQHIVRSLGTLIAACHARKVVLGDALTLSNVTVEPRSGAVGLLSHASLTTAESSSFDPNASSPSAYTAPEACTSSCNAQHDQCARDMWALGVILYTLCHRHFPYIASSPAALRSLLLTTASTQTSCLPLSPSLSPALHSLLSALLHPNPSLRLTAPQLLAHPFFTASDSQRVPHL